MTRMYETWESGPWDHEPDWERWTDEATGLICTVRRAGTPNWGGHLCGYVEVPPDHPWFEVGSVPLPDEIDGIDVHGGINMASNVFPSREGLPIYSPGSWWLGFDCSHPGDLSPSSPSPCSVYRDWDYVVAETHKLARAVHAAKETPND